MHLVSFVRSGRPGYGLLLDGGIVDLGRLLGDADTGLREVLARDGLDLLRRAVAGRRPDCGLSDVTLLPPIPDPGKILCVGLNYESHRAETKRPEAAYPTIFTRFADTQVAAGAPLVRPRLSEAFDWEGELAVVIGRGGRHIAEAVAMEHVAGYACYNDASVRDWQRHTHQFTPGKNFPATGAFGPALVTADEIADPSALRLTTRLDGVVMQDASLADLIFPIPRLVAYCSAFTPLSPGDVILTGTPGGVGDRREPPVYMKPGQTVEVEITGLGRLVNPIVAEV